MKILLVDDSAPVRRLIKSLISDFDVEVYECEDGAEAFEVFAAQLPDWVLMDVQMKKTNGFAAIKMIRESYPQARIIVVTNQTDQRTRKEAEETGAFAFVGKDDLMPLLPLLMTVFPILENKIKRTEIRQLSGAAH